MSVVDDSRPEVATSDVDPWAAAMREILANELPPEPTNFRRRAIMAVVVIVGLIVAGILIVMVGAALGAAPSGGCGGG